jgi:TPR repeat protein
MLNTHPPTQMISTAPLANRDRLKSLAQAGDAKAAYILARQIRETPEEASWMHISASKGYAPARAFLALYFADRSPLENDSEARKALFKNARIEIPAILRDLIHGAESGDIECMTSIPAVAHVGNSDIHPRLTEREADRLTLFWLRRAVQSRQMDAIYGVGLKYEFASYLRSSEKAEDRKEGFRMLRQSAKAGHLPSVLELWQIYANGDEKLGVKPHDPKAAYWEAVAERIEPGSTVIDDSDGDD